MSLNRKYTWKNFLEENPEFKEKKIKRTSPEGVKAFEAAYKAKIKDVLKDRLAWIEKEVERAGKKRTDLTSSIKAAKKPPLKRKIQTKISSVDKYLGRLNKLSTKTKQVQKNV